MALTWPVKISPFGPQILSLTKLANTFSELSVWHYVKAGFEEGLHGYFVLRLTVYKIDSAIDLRLLSFLFSNKFPQTGNYITTREKRWFEWRRTLETKMWVLTVPVASDRITRFLHVVGRNDMTRHSYMHCIILCEEDVSGDIDIFRWPDTTVEWKQYQPPPVVLSPQNLFHFFDGLRRPRWWSHERDS